MFGGWGGRRIFCFAVYWEGRKINNHGAGEECYVLLGISSSVFGVLKE